MKIFSGIKPYIPRPVYVPGMVAVIIASLICMWFMGELPNWTGGKTFGLSPLTLAILLGIILGNTVYAPLSGVLGHGVTYCKGQVLRLAIMMYGFKLTFSDVAQVGNPAIVADILTLTSTFLVAYWLGIKFFKMDRETTVLIGAGASICGAAAVIATEPVMKAKPHTVAIAVATVVVFGTIVMVLYPILYEMGWLHGILDPRQYGMYIGSTVHEVAQTVVAGESINKEVGNVAVITKMIRVMMLAPFLLVLSFVFAGDDQKSGSVMDRITKVQVPWFAFIFIGMVGVNTYVHFEKFVVAELRWVDDLLLTMAMFALGLTTHLSAIKQAGMKPLLLGLVLFFWLVLAGAGLNVLVSFIF